MKKQFLVLTVMLSLSVWLVTSCKKDDPFYNIEDVVDGATVTENSDIRINKVEYLDSLAVSIGGSIVNKTMTYTYNPQGKLINILENNNKIIDVGQREGLVNFSNPFNSTRQWESSQVVTNGKEISKINIKTYDANGLVISFDVSSSIDFKRNSNKQIQTIEPGATNLVSPYQVLGASVRIIEFYPDGLPKIIGITGSANIFYLQEISYQAGVGIPNKLKRMLNEEILRLNKMGLINIDRHFENNMYSLTEGGYKGVGNWLVSFGLHRFHVLSETSPKLVASIQTTKYQTETNGTQTALDSSTKTFLYIHDVDNRNISINGMKVYYDVIQKR